MQKMVCEFQGVCVHKNDGPTHALLKLVYRGKASEDTFLSAIRKRQEKRVRLEEIRVSCTQREGIQAE